MPVKKDKVITTSEWIIVKLIMLVPLVNIIMLFVWAFGDNSNLSKSNWAKASLVVWAIGFIFYFIFFLIFSMYFMSMFSNFFGLEIYV